MKARVFENRGSRVHVGSQLEFLKVGRSLELEDGSDGDKRIAEIDSVSVAIDPQTGASNIWIFDGAPATIGTAIEAGFGHDPNAGGPYLFFDLARVKSGQGSAPLPPVASFRPVSQRRYR